MPNDRRLYERLLATARELGLVDDGFVNRRVSDEATQLNRPRAEAGEAAVSGSGSRAVGVGDTAIPPDLPK